jgi:hypothetical protein
MAIGILQIINSKQTEGNDLRTRGCSRKRSQEDDSIPRTLKAGTGRSTTAAAAMTATNETAPAHYSIGED